MMGKQVTTPKKKQDKKETPPETCGTWKKKEIFPSPEQHTRQDAGGFIWIYP